MLESLIWSSHKKRLQTSSKPYFIVHSRFSSSRSSPPFFFSHRIAGPLLLHRIACHLLPRASHRRSSSPSSHRRSSSPFSFSHRIAGPLLLHRIAGSLSPYTSHQRFPLPHRITSSFNHRRSFNQNQNQDWVNMAQWSNEQLKCLLDTCLEEINRVGRRGGSLHKESWQKLKMVLHERFQMDLTQKQMKNAYDNLRQKYMGYVYLRNKTGNIYNPQTNSFNLTADEWEDFKKVYPKAGSLKTQPMPYPDLCAALYDGSSATGNNQWSSTVQTTSGGGTSSSAHHVQTLQTQDNPFDGLEDDEGTSVPNATDGIPPTNQEEPSSRGPPSKKPKLDLNELALDMQKALRHLIKSEGPTIDECHEKLKLVGLSLVDPLFLAAFNIFGQSSQMRESWMGLPLDPEVLKAWIQLTGKQFGIFN